MLGMLNEKPVVIAPRGEFSQGALNLHAGKKALFISISSLIGMYRNLIWQASCAEEARDISHSLGATERFSGKPRQIEVAIDLPQASHGPTDDVLAELNAHPALRVVFLSRITPKKNLHFALKVLAKVRVPVEFNIYGPIREEPYWESCKRLIEVCPANVKVSYCGSLAHEDVPGVFAAHDLFFLPTMGENYGHVMMESLSAGTPILVADTTPWRNLAEAGVGWDLPLNQEQPYVDRIEEAARISDDERRLWRRRVLAYAAKRARDPEIVFSNKQLFLNTIAKFSMHPVGSKS
jgi:glycosyltransferase involved in cell wall biosynthesis